MSSFIVAAYVRLTAKYIQVPVLKWSANKNTAIKLNQLSCSFSSRDINQEDKVLTVNLTQHSNFAETDFGDYKIELTGIDAGGFMQGTLTVIDKKHNQNIFEAAWQSLEQFKDIELNGGQGFTGLSYIFNSSDNSSRRAYDNSDLGKFEGRNLAPRPPIESKPELQYTCRVK